MDSRNPSSDDRRASLTRVFLSTAIGALLGAGYGALVLVTHLLSTGRWERAINYAAGAVAVSATLGLAGGVKEIFVLLRARYGRADYASPTNPAGAR